MGKMCGTTQGKNIIYNNEHFRSSSFSIALEHGATTRQHGETDKIKKTVGKCTLCV